MNYRRIAKYSFFSAIFLVVFLYGSFMLLMIMSENHLLESEPFHESIDVFSQTEHRVTPIDVGIHSLAQRLKLINEAKESIDLEFFIYELDSASRIVTNALLEKAKQGIKIRLLVDFSFAVLELRPAYAQELQAQGIEIRYYNTAGITRFFAVQHRTHRKLLITDNAKVILGGRNVGDDYFDLSPRYNFLDSDVLVAGPLVSDIRESFELYWNSKWTTAADDINDEQLTLDLQLNPADQKILAAAQELAIELPDYPCRKAQFVTDYPGSGVNYRKVYRAIATIVATAKTDILVESPYFILRKDGRELIHSIVDRGIKMTVLTNSLASTDAYYTVAASYPDLHKLQIPGFQLEAYAGLAPRAYLGPISSQRWGVHSKRAVIDDATTLIGTYNIDPRSANLNSELLFACYDSPELAENMRHDINRRRQQAEVVIAGDELYRTQMLQEASFRDRMLMYLAVPVANLFNFLL